MTYVPLANPSYLLPSIVFVIWDLICPFFFVHWIRKQQPKKIMFLLISKPFSLVVSVYFLFTQFGGAFFIGAAYLFLAPFIAFIDLIIITILVIKFRKEFGESTRLRWVNAIGAILLVISINIPDILFAPITMMCRTSDIQNMQIISNAMQEYSNQMDTYPDAMEDLVPEFLTEIPAPSCALLAGAPRQYEARLCEGQAPVIFVRTLDLVGFDLFSVEENEYFHVHSFLDNPDPGYCH